MESKAGFFRGSFVVRCEKTHHSSVVILVAKLLNQQFQTF